jgi:gliding motility-associated-like protein
VYASVNDQGTTIPLVVANAPFAESVYTNNFDSADYQPIAGTTLDTAICSGLSFKGHTVSGVYGDTVLSVGGCDSTNFIRLTIKPVAAVKTTINATICEGESYAGHTTTGTYVDNFAGSNTCDSVRTLNLVVNPVIRIIQNIKICRGKSTFVAGKMQTVSGIYIDSLKSAKGCDSIVTTNLTVDPFVPTRYTITICRGARFFAGGKMQTEPGVYTDTTTSSAGCDSVTVITLQVLPIIRATYLIGICQGQSYFAGGKLQTQSGLYADTVKTAGGCDSVTVTQLVVNPLPAFFLPADTTICLERALTINLTGYKSIIWSTGSSDPTITITQPGNYSAQVVDKNGCAGNDVIKVSFAKCIALQIPNAFTPNNDGKNDVFRPLLGVPPKNYTLQIYSRWGQLMFETHDATKGWNGKLSGELQQSGTYIYLITLIDPDGVLVVKKGTLVLIR